MEDAAAELGGDDDGGPVGGGLDAEERERGTPGVGGCLADAEGDGRVAVVVYGTSDVNLNSESVWNVYAMTWCASAPGVRTFARIDEVPVVTGTFPPGHFFQGVIDLDGTLLRGDSARRVMGKKPTTVA